MKQIFTLRLLLLAASTVGCASVYGQQSYLECDFSQGIPSTFNLIDGDQRQPSDEMKALGFEIGLPWIVTPVGSNSEMVACSTSWYKNAGKSDDWMITPAIEVASSEAVLQWRAMASDKELRDGYAVYISERGQQKEDFEGLTPVFKVSKEENRWVEHQVGLSDYAGKNIYVAFVNNSSDKTMLYIDDIFVGVPPKFSFSSNIGRIYNGCGQMRVTGVVSADKGSDIDGFTAGYTIGQYTQTFTYSQKIAAGKSVEFEFEPSSTIEKFSTVDYTVWAQTSEDRVEYSGKVSAYPQVVVAEEITGTWCGYCVRGIAAMEQMRQVAPENFIGIAVHADVSPTWPDAMGAGVEEYYQSISEQYGMSGFPNCIVNRNVMYKGNPESIPQWYSALSNDNDLTGVMLECSYDAESRQINTSTTIAIAQDMTNANYRVAYVIVENDVHKTYAESEGQAPNGYEQNNYYANNAMGPCGGFENLPSVIIADNMWYQDVARGIYPSLEGVEAGIKGDVNDGDIFTYDYTVTLPQNVMCVENAWLVVLLIDRDGLIRNADKAPITDTAGLNNLTNDAFKPNSDDLWYDLLGRAVKNPTAGFYIHNGKKVLK